MANWPLPVAVPVEVHRGWSAASRPGEKRARSGLDSALLGRPAKRTGAEWPNRK